MSFCHKSICRALAGLLLCITPAIASAYVGPGAGITAIGSVLALLVGVLLAVVGFIWYPLKRFMRSRSGKADNDNITEKNTADESESRKDG